MRVEEQPVVFACNGERMVGIAAQPERPADVGVLILVGGRQYRAGSHRQFTLLARRLASADFSSFRFDFRGMGDSEGARRGFEELDADIAAAIAAYRVSCPAVKRIVLWGLCDAATAAVLYWQCTRDAFIAGLCLVNPWLRSDESLAKTRVSHYYTGRAANPQFWMKLLRGGVRPLDSLREYFRHWRRARRPDGLVGYRLEMLVGLQSFPGPVMLLLSGQDLTAQEFVDTLTCVGSGRFLSQANLTRVDLPSADHTFSAPEWQRTAEQSVESWLARMR